jgi:hypothetical protein
MKENSQPLPGLEPPVIHPVVKRYTTEILYRNDRSEFIKARFFKDIR